MLRTSDPTMASWFFFHMRMPLACCALDTTVPRLFLMRSSFLSPPGVWCASPRYTSALVPTVFMCAFLGRDFFYSSPRPAVMHARDRVAQYASTSAGVTGDAAAYRPSRATAGRMKSAVRAGPPHASPSPKV